MSANQVIADIAEAINIDEYEPTLEELEFMAAKQLLLELKMIKKRIYDSGTVMNSMLVVQIKQILRGLMTKYQGFGMFIGETIELKLNGRGKFASFNFVYSKKLDELFAKVVADIQKQEVEAANEAAKVEEVQPKEEYGQLQPV